MGSSACQMRSRVRPGSLVGGGVLYMPLVGSSLSRNPNTRMSRIPIHHPGSAYDTAAAYDTSRSTREPTRVESHTPTDTPIAAVMSSAVVSSSRVLGSRSRMMSAMRLLPSYVRTVRASPRSNVSTLATIPGSRPNHGWSSP